MNCKSLFAGMFVLTLLTISLAPNAYSQGNTGLDYFLSNSTAYNPMQDKRISMDFKGANLNDVLKIFSQQSGLNFIASSEIASQTVNLYLDEVPVEEALERILSANNLTYEIKPGSNIFVVKQLQKIGTQVITRVYQLKHATVPTSKLNTTLSASEFEGEDITEQEEATSGIVAAIQSLLSEEGDVTEDARTNSLIVTDIPSQFPLIEQTIARLDIRTPQILIDVEMLDVAKSNSDLLGIKYGSSPFAFQGAEKTSNFPFDDEAGGSAENALAERYTLGSTSFSGLTALLQFLKSQNDTKSLARPRILTMNNETAEIQIATDEAIGVASTTTSSEGIADSVSSAERAQTGVFLKVTPQANLINGEITLAVEPRVSQARLGQTFTTSNGEVTFKDPEERTTRSILRIRDGDTVVLGGLLRTEETNINTRLPLVSKIPILGMAFRHKEKTGSERELIIFITPHIIKEDFKNSTLTQNKPINKNIVRERTPSDGRLKEIDKELSFYER